MRAQVVTDIHWGYEKPGKRYGDQASRLMETFIARANTSHETDRPVHLVADLGDRTTEINRDTDYAHTKALCEAFRRLHPDIARHHINGNYDIATMSRADNEALLGVTTETHRVDFAGDQISWLFWDANVTRPPDAHIGFVVPDHELSVLKAELEAAPYKVILCTHMPMVTAEQGDIVYRGGEWFNPYWYCYRNAAEIQDVIAEAGNVAVSLSGHRHRIDHVKSQGTEFFTLPSLTQADMSDASRAAESHVDVIVEDGAIRVELQGYIQREFDPILF